MLPVASLLCITLGHAFFQREEPKERLAKMLTLISFFFSLYYSAWLWRTYPRIGAAGAVTYPGFLFSQNGPLFEGYHKLNIPFLILSTFILIIGLLAA